MDELAYLSAIDALTLFWARELSPVELLTTQLARDETFGDDINAFTCWFSDAAMAAAMDAEDRYLARVPPRGPSKGSPAPSTRIRRSPVSRDLCVAPAADAVASSTAPLPQRVLDAGGIVHARTTMAEFGTHWATHFASLVSPATHGTPTTTLAGHRADRPPHWRPA